MTAKLSSGDEVIVKNIIELSPNDARKDMENNGWRYSLEDRYVITIKDIF